MPVTICRRAESVRAAMSAEEASAEAGTGRMPLTRRLLITLAVGWFLLAASPATAEEQAANAFTLASTAATSAGVYRSDGTDDVLVRTLWSGQTKQAGRHSLADAWDGKADDGTPLPPDGTYKIKVISSNMTVSWSVIGNTSVTANGTSYHGYSNLYDMAFTGNTAYVAGGLNEASPTKFKFDISNPQAKTNILPSGQGTSQDTRFVATDGTLVYWAEVPNFAPAHSFVHATNVSDDTQHIFENGIPLDPPVSIHFKSVISHNADTIHPTGLAVDKKYIFVAYASIDQVKVFDKTGLLVQTIPATRARKIRVGGGKLWMITGTNTVSRHAINGDGTISKAELTLAGLKNPFAVGIAQNNSKIGVVDGGGTSSVKFYNPTTGALLSTLGRTSSYETDATVYDDKFMFAANESYLAFQSDGSYWVGDYHNMRNQHFSASNVYKDNIAFTGVSYSATVDANNPSRVFSGMLEFSRDYSKPLAANNGSWKLVKNWRGGVDAKYFGDSFHFMNDTATLSNGRTYTFLRNGSDYLDCFELIDGGVARLAVSAAMHPSDGMDKDGSIYHLDGSGTNTENRDSVWYRRALIGFDSANNPQWPQQAVEIERIAHVSATDPVYRGDAGALQAITENGTRVSYDGGNWTGPHAYHVGGWRHGKWLFRTAMATHREYQGNFPADAYFDIGNSVNANAGGPLMVLGKFIFQGYHGEFYKQGQTNMFTIYHENGLYVGQFGVWDKSYQFGAPMMAGNALSAALVKIGADYYVHHCDESYNGGVHEFKVSGLDDTREQVIPIKYPANFTPVSDPSLMMPGLPFNSTITSDIARWSVTGAAKMTIRTSIYSYLKDYGHDLHVHYEGAAGDISVISGDLRAKDGLSNWTITGEHLRKGISTGFNGLNCDLRVVDASGKIIACLKFFTPSFANSGYRVVANGADLAVSYQSDDPDPAFNAQYVIEKVITNMRPLKISASSAGISFAYAGYPGKTTPPADPEANWRSPKAIQMYFNGGWCEMGLKDVKFEGSPP